MSQWIEGARPRTLPNAIAPVVVGTGAAAYVGDVLWWKAALALVVALALIIGVNFANDYSDGIRGTDDDRVGPLRLVGSGLARPDAVKAAAITCLGIAGVAGVIVSVTTAWWLLLVGALCILGAWYYTGGSRPYGYSGFGEIAVFVFFGLIAVLGTQFVVSGSVDAVGLMCAIAIGCFSSAVLVANNLRDIPTDTESGKLTLAVRLGDQRTRTLFVILIFIPFLITLWTGAFVDWWALFGFLALPLGVLALVPVTSGRQGFDLIPSIARTGMAMLVWAIATGVAIGLS